MRWMPEWPAVSSRQLSCLPVPSEVSTPVPVTTTTGRMRIVPCGSPTLPRPRPAPRRANDPRRSPAPGAVRSGIAASAASSGANRRRLDSAIAASARLAGNDGSSEWPNAVALARIGKPRVVQERRFLAVSRRPRRRRRRSPRHAGGSRWWRMASAAASAFAVASPGRRRQRSVRIAAICASGVAPRAAACSRLSITRKQPSEPSTMPPPCRLARPDAGERLLPQQLAHLVVQQHVGPLRVVRAADQEQVALAGGDARAGDADRVGAGGFLAHEGARRTDDAVHDGDVAGEQVGELRQEQRRAQVGQQVLVEVRAGIRAPWAARTGLRRPPRSRARRRRRPRSCPCATAVPRCPSRRRSPARGPRRRCRYAARPPSAAGRRAWGSACRAPAAPSGAPARARRWWHRPPAGTRRSAAQCASDAFAEAGDQADTGDQRVARLSHPGTPPARRHAARFPASERAKSRWGRGPRDR